MLMLKVTRFLKVLINIEMRRGIQERGNGKQSKVKVQKVYFSYAHYGNTPWRLHSVQGISSEFTYTGHEIEILKSTNINLEYW